MFNFNNLSSAMRRVLLARERIARRTAFFASILFNAKLVESNKHQTIWTDGINVYFNPEYVKDNDQFIEGDILEVVMHCAMQHLNRRKHRELERWNEACDLSIRPLVHQFFRQNPELESQDANPKFRDKAAEEIYEILEKQQGKKPPPGGGQGQGEGDEEGEQPGGMVEPDPDQQEEAEAAGKQWERTVANAAEKATKAGNMPGNIKRLIEQLLPVEKLDWRDLARDMSRDAKSKSSRSWSRVNRRHNGHDGNPPMPGYADDNIYNLIICFDVSGSVNDDMLQNMKSETAALIDQDLVNQVTLIAVDTRPGSIEVVTNSDGVLNWHPKGGGGTDFRSAMELIKEEYGNSVGMLFLTDMETMSYGEEPPFPVVWVNFAPHNNRKAPFGRTVEY
jgi:predicted metal-dependent peptidase